MPGPRAKGPLLLASIGISTLGDGIRYAALPLAVALAGGSAPLLGVLLAAGTAPFLVVGLVGGAVVDRVDRARILRVADLSRFLLALVFAVLLLLDAGRAGILLGALVLAVGMGLGEAVAFPAVFALTPNVVAQDELHRFNGRMVSVQTLGRDLLGPLVGAALITLAAPAPFAVDGITFLASWWLVTRLGRQPAPEREPGRTTLRADVRAGLHWLRGRPRLLHLAVGGALINLGNMGFLATEVFYVLRGLGAPSFGYGLMMAAASVGGAAGGLLSDRWADRWADRPSDRGAARRDQVLWLACAGISLGMAVIATAPHLVVALLGSALVGLAFATYNVAAVTLRQHLTPDAWRGRSDSLYRLIAWGVLPLGSLTGGVLSGWAGPRGPAAFTAVTTLVAAIWLLTTVVRPGGQDAASPAEPGHVRTGVRGSGASPGG